MLAIALFLKEVEIRLTDDEYFFAKIFPLRSVGLPLMLFAALLQVHLRKLNICHESRYRALFANKHIFLF